MSDRYTRLESLPANLYAKGSPVLIEAGALLKDNTDESVLAQLKFRNLQVKNIRALTVEIVCMDTAGRGLGKPLSFDYLDLDVGRDRDFGSQVPLGIPDKATRSVYPRVTEVIFADKSLWSGTDEPWEQVDQARPLAAIYSNRELLKQFKIKYGENCRQLYREHKDLWICACGGVNREHEEQCHLCHLYRETIANVNDDELRDEMTARLKKEAEGEAERRRLAAEEQARREAELQAKKEKAISFAKKYWKYAVIGLVAVILLATVPKKLRQVAEERKRKQAYEAAVQMLEDGQYAEAEKAFLELGFYEDSSEKADEAKALKEEQEEEERLQNAYDEAAALLKEGKYEEAIRAFEKLDDFRDSAEQAENARKKQEEAENAASYEEAEKLLKDGDYEGAITAFRKLGGYKDSKDQIKKAQELQEEAEKEEQYQSALAAMEEGDLAGARELFTELGDYQDSKAQLETLTELEKKEAFRKIAVYVRGKGADNWAFRKKEEFEGTCVRMSRIGLYEYYLGVTDEEEEVLHLFLYYPGKKEERDLYGHMQISPEGTSYTLEIPNQFSDDQSIERVIETGTIDMENYQLGDEIRYETIEAPISEEKIEGFAEQEKTRTYPTEPVEYILKELQTYLRENGSIALPDLGFEKIN